MSPKYAPQRRTLLQHETANSETGLIVRPGSDLEVGPHRQVALSVPESVRALGEPLEPFFDACGGRQSISLSVSREDGRAPSETCVFQQPFVLIGRCPESDLALTDGTSAFRHYYLQLAGGRWMFVDLARLAGATAEEDGQVSGWFDVDCSLTSGPYTITHVLAATQTPTSGTADWNADLPSFELELVNARRSSRFGRTLRFSTSVTLIGASRQCDVWLKDESVSSVHASLVLTSRGLWIVDLLGRDGVRVDGRRAYWRQIHEGSILQIGRLQLRVRLDAKRVRRTPADGAKGRDSSQEERGTSSAGSLSEEAVLALVGQVAEMQSQFFEHSQFQMQLITQMLAHLSRTQQTEVRHDLARIDEIGRELQEIQTQLASPPEAKTPRQSRKKASTPRKPSPRKAKKGPTANPARTEPIDQASSARPATPAAQNLRETAPFVPGSPPSLVPPTVSSAGAAETFSPSSETDHDADQTGKQSAADYHARLTQRLAALSQERTSRWRRITNVFSRKPDPRGNE